MVLIDGVVFANQQQKGIQRYFYELLSRAVSQVPLTVFLDTLPVAPIPERCPVIVRPEQRKTSRLQPQLWAWRTLRRNLFPTKLPAAAVFHSTFFTRSPVKKIPEVLTVYDMVVERMPYYFGLDCDWQLEQKADCIRSAEHIIAISQNTADELLSFYPETRGRVTVIHLGAEHLPRVENPGARKVQPRPYSLFVGDRFRYKNFTTLLAAMTAAQWDPELGLHVVGPPFLASEALLIRRLGLEERIVHCGRLDEGALAAEYAGCTAFVFPSLYEGFGFPILEAQSCGAPVVCSDIPVFREVAGAAAEFFDPLSPDSLIAALRRSNHGAERGVATEAGAKNLSRFSWDECARRTVQLWNSLQ